MRPVTAHWTLLTAAVALTLAAGTIGTAEAGLHIEASYTSEPVDVRVWLDRGYDYYDDFDDAGSYYDVYPSADDVVLYVRAARSCYTTVYVIDTEGFIHVVHPFSAYDDAYLVGGRVYRIWLSDFGFHRRCFGWGVAFAFAVSSPFPFAYANYGPAVFGPHIGFQIYGDPFVAARLFYLSILPPACPRGFVAVSYARFYVREYVQYPSYLCLGWCEPRGGHAHYSGSCGAHRHYRIHAKDPYRVLRPAADADREVARYTRIAPSKDVSDVRVSKAVQGRAVEDAAGARVSRPVLRTTDAVREAQPRTAEKTAPRGVVRSTKESYVTGKRNYEKMREIYEGAGNQSQGEVRSAETGARNVTSTKVAPRAVKEARETVALGDAAPAEKTKSGKSAKRVK